MTKLLRRLLTVLIALAVLGFIAYALWPRPVAVDVATIDFGPLRVTVNEDGKTRIKEKYVVSAPLAGRLTRVTLKEGDVVTAGQTVLASIDPTDPTLLDPRAEAQAQARIKAAEASLDRARAEVARTNASLELAQSELTRIRTAAERQAATKQEVDDAVTQEMIRTQEVRSAEFSRDVAKFELELAQAALMHSGDQDEQQGWRFDIQAPISGRVLRVFQESAAVVQPGTPLIEIGEPSDLEIVVDVLSSDAVAIQPGDPVSIEQWGGDKPLNGRVRLVEPAAFTKVSALGVEEQRVNVIIDFTDPPEARAGLGDAYRVETRIQVWEEPHVLIVPTGALFRHAESWAVYVDEDGRAQQRDVAIGRRSGTQAQVLSGLDAGESVIVYPSDRVQAGTRIVKDHKEGA